MRAGAKLKYARTLRARMTDAERLLWSRFRRRQVLGHRFRRQVPIGPYIVDFLCVELRVVIEVDGGQHAESADDARRDSWLASNGYRVLRYWNNDVLQRTDEVLAAILDALQETPAE